MFTGIVQAVGHIAALEKRGGDVRMLLDAGELSGSIALGDSIAVSGVCLTAVDLDGPRVSLDVSNETLALTTLGSCEVGDRVNLELALTPSTRMGGHIVSGHVDGVGEVVDRHPDARSVRFKFAIPRSLARYVAVKGSVTVDGVSLTINAVGDTWFSVNLVPHTLAVTTLGAAEPGRRVNIEVDLLARYLERLVSEAGMRADTGLSLDDLRRAGFIAP